METRPSALPELGRGDIGQIQTIRQGIDPLRLRLLLLIVSLNITVALSASPRSFAVEQRSDFRLGCGPMSAKAKVKSHKWFYRGHARFT
jgi:hypothetical protein